MSGSASINARKPPRTICRSPATSTRLAQPAREAFDAVFFNNITLVLDRYFVHRFAGPKFEGKDGNPLKEVRLLTDSVMNHDSVMRADKQIKLPPERSVLGIAVGERMALSEDQFERLSEAFFAELETRFLRT